MDAYTNVLRHSGVLLVDMDALPVNSNHLANDPARNPGRPRKRRIRPAGEAGGKGSEAPLLALQREGPQRRDVLAPDVLFELITITTTAAQWPPGDHNTASGRPSR